MQFLEQVALAPYTTFQIGGPAAAFIVLVAATVHQFGVDGLILATFLSGLILFGVGLLRLGTFIKYIPYPVTVGFTAGIAVIILISQVTSYENWVMMAVPLAAFHAAAYYFPNKTLGPNILHWMIIAYILAMNYFIAG